jgi:hypothetical protein
VQPHDATLINPSPRFFSAPSLVIHETEIGGHVELNEGDGDVSITKLSVIRDVDDEQHQNDASRVAIVTTSQHAPDPFETPQNYMVGLPGTIVDRTWKLSMISFVFGALPQAVKVFGMQGIPFTQGLVGIFLVSFIVPEVFRWFAGPVGQVNLRPLPIVVHTKNTFSSQVALGLYAPLSLVYVVTGPMWCTFIVLPLPSSAGNLWFAIATPPYIVFAYLMTKSVLGFVRFIASWALCATRLGSVKLNPIRSRSLDRVRGKFVPVASELFAMSSSTLESNSLFACLYACCLAGVMGEFRKLWSSYPTPPDNGFLEGTLECMSIVGLFFILPLTFAISYVLYRVMFVGFLPSTFRRFCDIHGTLSEFFTGVFITIHFGIIFSGYVGTWYNDEEGISATFKPGWAELLG